MVERTPQTSRRERKKMQTRGRILSAALGLFAERGYGNVRIDDIRERADIANATFFAYFPTKASLIAAFGEHLSGLIAARLAEYDAGPIESLELLRVHYFDEWADYAGVLRQMNPTPDSPEGNAIASSSAALVEMITQIIARGQENGDFSSSCSPYLAAHCLAGGWRAVMNDFLESGDVDAAMASNRQVLDVLLDGMV